MTNQHSKILAEYRWLGTKMFTAKFFQLYYMLENFYTKMLGGRRAGNMSYIKKQPKNYPDRHELCVKVWRHENSCSET